MDKFEEVLLILHSLNILAGFGVAQLLAIVNAARPITSAASEMGASLNGWCLFSCRAD